MSLKKPKAFITLGIISLLIRVVNPTFGLPTLYVIPDEVDTHLAAFEMIASRTITTFSYYPPLGSYIQIPFLVIGYIAMRLFGLISSLKDFQLYVTSHEGAFLFIPRLLSGVFGAATVVMVYLIALEIFVKHKYKHSIALWSMFFMAFLGTHLRLSHTGKSWAASMFFGSLSLYFLLRSINYRYKKGFHVIISSLTLALAGGFHFTAYFLLIPLILIRISQFKLKKLLHQDNLISFIAISIPILSFFIYNLLRTTTASYPRYILENFQLIIRQLNVYNLKGYLESLFFSEPVFTVFLFSSLLLINKWGKTLKILGLYAGTYFVVFAVGYHPQLSYLHYVLHIFVVLSVFVGFATHHYLHKLPKVFRPFLIIIIVSGTILPQLFWLYLYHQIPTFIESKDWINQHIDQSTPIAYTDIRYVPFVPALKSIKLMQENQPGTYIRLSQVLPENTYSDNIREMILLPKITIAGGPNYPQVIMEYATTHRIKFIIQHYWDPAKKLLTEATSPQLKLIITFPPFRTNTTKAVLKNFIYPSGDLRQLFAIRNLGPYIDIFEIK